MAIRAALGAGRGRLIRQMLTESLLLTLTGGLIGLGMSIVCVRLMSNLIRLDLPPWMIVSIDARVLLFTLTASTVAGVATALIPALRASKADLNEALKEGSKGLSSSSGSNRARRVLVVAQIALALLLLVSAGLMMNSFLRLQQVALGFDSGNLLTMKMDPPWFKYKELNTAAQFYKRVIEEVEKVPGVESAAFNDSLPLAGQDVREGANKLNIEIEGQQITDQQENPYVNAQIVSQGYFWTMRIRLLNGRVFDERDRGPTTPVAIVSQRVADHFWPSRDPIGKRLRLTGRGQNFRPASDESNDPWLTIVGVAEDVRQRGMTTAPGLDVYVSDQQILSPESYIAVRSKVEPMSLFEPVKRALWQVDPEQSVFDIQTMQQRVLNTIWQQRLSGIVLMLFAGLALVLASVGIYGVMSYLVGQRTREIGLRMALGAQAGDVLKLVLGQGLKLVLAGIVLGLAGALVSARVMASLLFGVSATDPATLAIVATTLTLVAMLACYLPARRAAKIDPMIALHEE
jgi:putative ABC transport system permease protein